MIELKFKLTQEIIFAAYGYEQLRKNGKNYLTILGKNYDKFTIVEHDSFIGYITEYAIKEYINESYQKDSIKVISWDAKFDIDRIKEIIDSSSYEEDDIKLIEKYFYDEYDLELKYADKYIFIDVKTALTQKEPNPRWNFMYPVIQANKIGKDYMLLTYYVVQDVKEVESLKKVIIVGYISEDIIKKCNIIKRGQKTRFGTKSQIDNYETELSVHYKEIDNLIHTLKGNK